MGISRKIVLFLAAGIVLTLMYITNISTLTFALQPGSAEDPLISRSYLEERLASFGTSNNINVSDEVLNLIVRDVTNAIISQMPNSNGHIYTPVNALVGQVIIGDEGTEIILRSGGALVYTEVNNGLVNVTTGEELLNGDRIELNHNIIVPRNDGRGLLVTNESWFIIKGGYTII